MNIFKGLVHVLKVAFTNPTAIRIEAGIASLVLPGFGGLINSAANALITAETSAIAIGTQSGTGAQKMAMAIQLFEQTYQDWAAQNGLATLSVTTQELLQDVFNLLGKFTISGQAAVIAATAAQNAAAPAVAPEKP